MVNTYYWGEMSEDKSLKSDFLNECISLERGGSE
jgi:hypothetical protein